MFGNNSMFKIQFSKQAHQDLKEIEQYISKTFASKAIAMSAIFEIKKHIAVLEVLPTSFINFDRKTERKLIQDKETWLLISGKNLIFYVIDPDIVTIMRILPAKRDYLQMLNELQNPFNYN